jgi:hypothetical protein
MISEMPVSAWDNALVVEVGSLDSYVLPLIISLEIPSSKKKPLILILANTKAFKVNSN